MDAMVFFVFLFFLIVVGTVKTQHIRSENSYFFAERKTSGWSLTTTLIMTEFNSATLISFAAMGYAAGFWALTLPCVFLCGLLFYAGSVAKKWKEFNGTSVAGFFAQNYGRSVGVITSSLLVIAMMGFSAAYVKSLTLLFMPLFPSMNPWILSALLLSIVLCMSLRGGLISIIRTDIASFLVMILFFPLVALFMWKSPGMPSIVYPDTFNAENIVPLRFVISLTMLTMFTYILAPWYGQKIFAAASPRTAYVSVIAAAFGIFVLYGSIILAAAFFRYRGFNCASPEMAFPHLINQCLPLGLRGLAYALLFATSATTLTGVWSAMSSMWIGDFMKESEQTGFRRSIVITLICALLSFLLANLVVDRVFDKMILANIPVAALSFGLLAGFHWKRVSKKGVLVSMVVGCLCGVGAYVFFGEARGYTWYWAIYGIPLSFLSGIGISLLFPDRHSLATRAP